RERAGDVLRTCFLSLLTSHFSLLFSGTSTITVQPAFGSSSRLAEATRKAPFSSTPNMSTLLEPYCSTNCGQSNVLLSLVDLIRQPCSSISAKRPWVIVSSNSGGASRL